MRDFHIPRTRLTGHTFNYLDLDSPTIHVHAFLHQSIVAIIAFRVFKPVLQRILSEWFALLEYL